VRSTPGYSVAIDGRYTVTVTVGGTEAAAGAPGREIDARMRKRPMWLALQVAPKVPLLVTVAVAVSAHCQPVWWPRRSIATVSPASLAGSAPEKVRPCLSIAEAYVDRVMLLALAVTGTSPGRTIGRPGAGVAPASGPEPSDVPPGPSGEPPTPADEPTALAEASTGAASSALTSTRTAEATMARTVNWRFAQLVSPTG
jgi:hypothetical protein